MTLSWTWRFSNMPKMIGSQLRIRVSEVEDVAEDFQQFQFPELDGAGKGGLWSYNPKVLVSTFCQGRSGFWWAQVYLCWHVFVEGKGTLKQTRVCVGMGVYIQNVTTPKTEVHLISSGWSHLLGISWNTANRARMPKIEVDLVRLATCMHLIRYHTLFVKSFGGFRIEVLQIHVAGCGITRGNTWKR